MNSPDDAHVRALLLDIEGTTTSVDFVYKTLFPYAHEHLGKFVDQHYGNEDLIADIKRLRQDHVAEASQSDCPPWRNQSREEGIASIVFYVHWLIGRDRKSTALKSLQGKIWEEGYRRGELEGHVYPDVLPAFQRWQRNGKAICIFSSGSILAQKPLFTHTSERDLSSFIRAYFDTTTGVKNDSESYKKIANSLALPPATILFVSDSIAKLDAASSAGMSALLCVRQEIPETDSQAHRVIRNFAEILS